MLEGYDPARVRDPLFVDDPSGGEYAPLDAMTYERLQRGLLRPG